MELDEEQQNQTSTPEGRIELAIQIAQGFANDLLEIQRIQEDMQKRLFESLKELNNV